ncbi:MAG: cob(I)yrinic acid a,c-diamide adenosyltransferase [Phycisphaerae bacterium]|nr:cob(I)yrinic acid a,c-diamide adenosyltransferase [Phycisphaerae bacterium]
MTVLDRGMLQIYTGNGKGKTTAAFGLAWRMLGVGGKVYICQFLKPSGQITGESELARQFTGALTLDRLEQDWNMKKGVADKAQVAVNKKIITAKLKEIRHLVQQGKYDLVILDEIVFCLNNKLANRQDLQAIIDSRAQHVELVLTGRGADEKLIEQADLVTEMRPVKHPFNNGITARRGIEF